MAAETTFLLNLELILEDFFAINIDGASVMNGLYRK